MISNQRILQCTISIVMRSIRETSPRASSSSSASTMVMSSILPFLSKTYDMVDDPLTNEIVSSSGDNNSFVVTCLRSLQINENVARKITNYTPVKHPNIIRQRAGV